MKNIRCFVFALAIELSGSSIENEPRIYRQEVTSLFRIPNLNPVICEIDF